MCYTATSLCTASTTSQCTRLRIQNLFENCLCHVSDIVTVFVCGDNSGLCDYNEMHMCAQVKIVWQSKTTLHGYLEYFQSKSRLRVLSYTTPRATKDPDPSPDSPATHKSTLKAWGIKPFLRGARQN